MRQKCLFKESERTSATSINQQAAAFPINLQLTATVNQISQCCPSRRQNAVQAAGFDSPNDCNYGCLFGAEPDSRNKQTNVFYFWWGSDAAGQSATSFSSFYSLLAFHWPSFLFFTPTSAESSRSYSFKKKKKVMTKL